MPSREAGAAFEDAGQGRYAGGLITLPDGAVHGVETIVRVEIRGAERPQAGDVVGAVRSALGAALSLPLPFRIAASGLRAGLGALEEGLRPAEGLAPVTLTLREGIAIETLMPIETAILIRRDAEIVRSALARAGDTLPEALPFPSTGQETAALTSIFRYEKRNGRLRRVAVPEGDPKP